MPDKKKDMKLYDIRSGFEVPVRKRKMRSDKKLQTDKNEKDEKGIRIMRKAKRFAKSDYVHKVSPSKSSSTATGTCSIKIF